MARMACINLPAFPLQLLVKHNPDWKDLPAVVVDKDTPQGTILWVNKRALRDRILPGMRYAKGLSLNPDLRAGVVSDEEIKKQITHLTELFRFYTPNVEPSHEAGEAGVFWLDASGLSLLYPSLKKWAGLIGSDLSKIDFYWSITVGFSRYGVYAMAKSSKGITVFANQEQERSRVRAVPIVRLGADPNLRDALEQLGITTLGGFMDLPAAGIRKRFGDAAYNLYKLARDELYAPLEARPPEERFVAQHSLDYPENNAERLLRLIEEHLDVIFKSLEAPPGQPLYAGCRLLAGIAITLVLDDGETRTEHLRPAAPTNDLPQVLKLVDLRLQQIALDSGVVEFTLDAETVSASHKQLELFAKKPRRDLRLADRAFAQLRAQFGDHVVMRATLRNGHLPEASYEWRPMEKLTRPAPRHIKARTLVRRIFPRAVELFSWIRSQGDEQPPHFPPSDTLPSRDRHRGTAQRQRPIVDVHNLHGRTADVIPSPGPQHQCARGPYIVSGGWWMRRVHREYYYVRSTHGRWLWVYYDRRRRQSFIQGVVE